MESLSPEVKISPGDANELGFERLYKVRINGNVNMKIRTKYFLGSVFLQGELTQTDGRWVIFEPERPADKILDRDILPAVQKYCREIIAADKAYRANPPETFRDNQGRTWKRVN